MPCHCVIEGEILPCSVAVEDHWGTLASEYPGAGFQGLVEMQRYCRCWAHSRHVTVPGKQPSESTKDRHLIPNLAPQ
jgi:hypothetical protein